MIRLFPALPVALPVTLPVALAAAALLTACGPPQPLTRDSAARLCAPEARAADGVTGHVGAGGGSNGPFAAGRVTITSDIRTPRPEAEALEDCIQRRLATGDRGPAPRPTFSISLGGRT